MVVEWADPSRQRKENPNAKGMQVVSLAEQTCKDVFLCSHRVLIVVQQSVQGCSGMCPRLPASPSFLPFIPFLQHGCCN